jgi:hypothetical protein
MGTKESKNLVLCGDRFLRAPRNLELLMFHRILFRTDLIYVSQSHFWPSNLNLLFRTDFLNIKRAFLIIESFLEPIAYNVVSQ